MAYSTELCAGVLFKMYKVGLVHTTPKTPDFLKMK